LPPLKIKGRGKRVPCPRDIELTLGGGRGGRGKKQVPDISGPFAKRGRKGEEKRGKDRDGGETNKPPMKYFDFMKKEKKKGEKGEAGRQLVSFVEKSPKEKIK